MATLRKYKRLLDAYRFAGFRPQDDVRGVFGDSAACVVTRVRRSKKPSARGAVERTWAGTTARHIECAICPVATCGFIWNWKSGEFSADVVATRGENNSTSLADNPFYTKRFAWSVGRRRRSNTAKDVADDLHLDWQTVKEIDKQYMTMHVGAGRRPRPSFCSTSSMWYGI